MEEQYEKKLIDLVRCSSEFLPNSKAWAYGLSLIGADHQRNGVPCQDYLSAKAYEDHDAYLYVVSDGHGSVQMSEYGSKIATETLSAILDDCFLRNFEDSDIVRFFTSGEGKQCIISRWVKDVEDDALSREIITQEELYDSEKQKELVGKYGATLLFCIVLREQIITGVIGDGTLLMIDRKGETVSIVIVDDDKGDSTISLSHQRKDFISVKIFSRKNIRFVFLASDGIGKPYSHCIKSIATNCASGYIKGDNMKQEICSFMIESQPKIGDDISMLFGAF